MSTATVAVAAPASAPQQAATIRRGSLVIPVLLFVGAAASITFRVQTGHLGNGFETVAVARSIAEHGQFANPYSVYLTGTTAHVSPLYPAFLALLLRIFGYTESFGLAVWFFSIVVHGLHAAILPRVSELLFRDRRPGIWAALLTIALPLYFFFPQFEVIYFATAGMLFCLISHRLACRGGNARAFATGLLLGLITLLNPASLPITVPWLAYLLWRHVGRERARFILYAGVGILVALAPWTWRNYQQFHALFLVRDNLGLELYVSNTDLAQASFQQNNATGLYQSRHPDQSLHEARECARLGEIAYNRERLHLALAWMKSHPSEFLALSATRARMFWFPDVEGFPFYAYGIAGVTIASALGFFLLCRRREPVMLFLAAVQLLYPLLYYTVQIDPRFRSPILWISLLGTGYLLTNGWNSMRRLVQHA